jgi:dTDP-4-dehydrorhamnose 3,5-epimerase
MKSTPLAIPDVIVFEPKVFGDDRGFFFESFNHRQFEDAVGKSVQFVQDIAVDIRKNSPRFGKWVGEVLSAENKKQLWVPEGFAHGFVTLSDTAEFLYKTTNYYAPAHERCIKWDDAAIGITWNISAAPLVSAKDQVGKALHQAELFN